jgi:hypothetical protein
LLMPLVVVEVWQFRSRNFLVALTPPDWAKAIVEGALLLGIAFFWERREVPFIYFQF